MREYAVRLVAGEVLMQALPDCREVRDWSPPFPEVFLDQEFSFILVDSRHSIPLGR
jgi:hypothetical protein